MLTGELHIVDTLKSLGAFQAKLYVRLEESVRNTAQSLMQRVIAYTVAPAPPPPVKYYVRTNRLVGGWEPAANFVGLGVPGSTGYYGREGEVEFGLFGTDIIFRATNHVPYASAVELSGTWETPFPSRRPGYGMVLRSSQETEEDFSRNLQIAWNGVE